jgi:GT2 family glycosyltransferase
MQVGIMIATLNRVSELHRTLDELQGLSPRPAEVWVVADGCSDGTAEYIRARHPYVRLIVHEQTVGSVRSRDEVMRRTASDLILALDDDSYPEQSTCLATLNKAFDMNSRLGVATFPQRTDEYPESLKQVDFGSSRLVRSFANSGACLRVSTYRLLAGFEPLFFHMYEEPDYALQCIANRWDVMYFPDITIRHHYSGQARDEIRIHHRHARNELWSTLTRCPFPFAIGIVLWRVFSQFRYACKRGWSWVVREPAWWCQALAGVPYCLRKRRPVSWASYKRWLALP